MKYEQDAKFSKLCKIASIIIIIAGSILINKVTESWVFWYQVMRMSWRVFLRDSVGRRDHHTGLLGWMWCTHQDCTIPGTQVVSLEMIVSRLEVMVSRLEVMVWWLELQSIEWADRLKMICTLYHVLTCVLFVVGRSEAPESEHITKYGSRMKNLN